MEVTTIGALVSISTNLAGALKAVRDIFVTRRDSAGQIEDVIQSFNEYQARLQVLASQLTKAEMLARMLPGWDAQFEAIPIWNNDLSDNDVMKLDQQLRNLIHDSIHDNFSGTFFHTDFATLPEIPSLLHGFRSRLLDLERDLTAIQLGDQDDWRRRWPALKVRLGDLDREARGLGYRTEDVISQLVRELEAASKATLPAS